jgi:hypothetical protein
MLFNATFNNISVLSWRSVYWWGKPKKTTDLPKSLTKFITLRCIESTSPERHDKTEILLKVALKSIAITLGMSMCLL